MEPDRRWPLSRPTHRVYVRPGLRFRSGYRHQRRVRLSMAKGWKMTPEQRQRVSAAKKGVPHSPETRAKRVKVYQAQIGQRRSQEAREKMRLAQARRRGDGAVLPSSESAKTCTKCRQLLPFERFPASAEYVDGLESRCKDCRRKDGKPYRQAWDAKNLDRRVMSQRTRNYGLTPDDFAAIIEAQGNRCAGCAEELHHGN